VTAKPVTPEEAAKIVTEPPRPGEPTEVPSPMLVEVQVPPERFTGKNAERPSSWWSTRKTAHFICDKAQVRSLGIERDRVKKGNVRITITAEVGTDWFRQDVDLTVVLRSADGREIAKRTWDDLTIGKDSGANFGGWAASSTKRPKLEHVMPESDFLALFANSQQPMIRVLVDIQE
jgi:hypothetical protein